MPYSITFPGRMTDQGYSWPVTLTAPEGWVPRGYHVAQCVTCHAVMEPYGANKSRLVHRATGWAVCSPR